LRRLSQIVLQMKLAQAGYGSTQALAAGDVADELGITDEQRAQLKEKEQEVMQEMREKLQEFQKKLQEESREKLLGVLTPAQRRSLDAMVGEKFQWQPQVVVPAVSPAPAVPAPLPRIDLKPPSGGENSKLPRSPQGD
jgi:Spy/CpxP family protein refolding chaperone